MGDTIVANMPAAKDDPLRGKKTGKWTKYGGAISGLVKAQIEDCWYCQVCGEEIPKEIKPFLFEQFLGDFIRVCPSCTHVIAKLPPTIEVETVIRIVRLERS
jgi:hypothetical protein